MADILSIAFLCHASRGGSTKVALELATKLSERGHRIHILSLDPIPLEVSPHVGQSSVLARRGDGRPVGDLHLHWTPEDKEELILELLEQHRRHGFDLVHFHYAIPFAEIVGEMRTRLGPHAPKAIGTLHGTDVSGQAPDGWGGQRSDLSYALNQTDLLTTVSQAYSHLARVRFGLRTTPDVIPNFIDAETFKPVRKSRQSMAARQIRLTHISNFRPVKNPLAVARLFEAIRRRVNCELWLIGDGQELQSTKAYLLQAGLMPYVQCFGFRNDVYRILPKADILLMPSNQESFCLAALEAMACGLPVVATRVGGLPELIQHSESGYLFDRGDLHQGARYVEQLSADPELYFRVRRSAIRRARAFDACQITTQYELRYWALLALRGSPPAGAQTTAPAIESRLAVDR